MVVSIYVRLCDIINVTANEDSKDANRLDYMLLTKGSARYLRILLYIIPPYRQYSGGVRQIHALQLNIII